MWISAKNPSKKIYLSYFEANKKLNVCIEMIIPKDFSSTWRIPWVMLPEDLSGNFICKKNMFILPMVWKRTLHEWNWHRLGLRGGGKGPGKGEAGGSPFLSFLTLWVKPFWAPAPFSLHCFFWSVRFDQITELIDHIPLAKTTYTSPLDLPRLWTLPDNSPPRKSLPPLL